MRTRTSPRNQEILWRRLGGLPPKRRKVSRDPVITWEGPIASREYDHGIKNVPFIKNDVGSPSWHTHYLCVQHERDEKRTKKSGLTIIKRRWYLTIDGTSKTFIPEHEALGWLLARATEEASSSKILNSYECDLIRTINLG